MSELKASKYQAYSEYKDSGVEWVGCIPSHWKTISVKYIADLISTGGTPKDSTSFTDENEVPWFSPSDFHNGSSLSSANKYVTWESVNTKDSKLYKANSVLVIGIGATLGKVAHCLTPFSCNQQINVISPNYRVDDFFLMHALSIQSEQMIQNSNSSTIGIMNQEKTKDLIIALPAKVEQQNIANFLDHETAKIDTLIEKQQQLIKLLKEKRQAVISHAVTKGLNPQAPIKDSGVEWLGEVPEHWDVINMHYALNAIGDVDHYMPQSVDKGIPYVMTGNLTELASNISFEQCKQVSKKDYLKLSNKIKSAKGDVIMARYATIGTVSYIDIDRDFLVSYSCVTIKPNPLKVVGLYLYYYFKSHAFLEGIQSQINTNTQGNVGVNDLKKIKVTL
ncbi:restriction endonuclease subunit S, partial [Pseudoalteromonas sp. BSi20495]|uniref:restriction endonuclease subunit S n=1 Tax=Pseudoalteromonas sp. BSi20495 TaxID=386429 RepID=UPI0006ACFE10